MRSSPKPEETGTHARAQPCRLAAGRGSKEAASACTVAYRDIVHRHAELSPAISGHHAIASLPRLVLRLMRGILAYQLVMVVHERVASVLRGAVAKLESSALRRAEEALWCPPIRAAKAVLMHKALLMRSMTRGR